MQKKVKKYFYLWVSQPFIFWGKWFTIAFSIRADKCGLPVLFPYWKRTEDGSWGIFVLFLNVMLVLRRYQGK